MNSEIAKTRVNTSCRDCVFAIYDGDSQTDCRLDRLRAFVAAGADVRPVSDYLGRVANEEYRAEMSDREPEPVEEREDDKDYFVINGRICLACRNVNTDWPKAYPPDKWADQVRDETRVKMHAVVVVRPGDTLDSVAKTVNSLEQQTLPARRVHVVLATPDVKRHELVQRMRKMGPALVYNIIVPSGPPVWTVPMCVDMAVKDMKQEECNFYAVFHPGVEVPRSFVTDIDKAVNTDLHQFLLLEPFEGQGTVVSLRMHQLVGGNRPAEHDLEDGTTIRCDSVESKIHQMTEDDKCQHLIKKAADLCPALALR
jgi:hypothetical protein